MTIPVPIATPLNAAVLAGSVRRAYIEAYSWAIPSELALERIAHYSPRGVLELGAGTGYWGMLLISRGVDVVAVDPLAAPIPDGDRGVYQLDHREARRPYHWPRTLLLIWPSRAKSWPSEALGYYRGKVVIYIGTLAEEAFEDTLDACATPSFFKRLQRDFTLAETVAIPNWRDQNDRMEVWIRKGAAGAGNQN